MITATEARERSSKNLYDEFGAIMSLIEAETMKTDKHYIILHDLPSKQTRDKLRELGYQIMGEYPLSVKRYTNRCARYYIAWFETKKDAEEMIFENYEF